MGFVDSTVCGLPVLVNEGGILHFWGGGSCFNEFSYKICVIWMSVLSTLCIEACYIASQ